MTATNAKPRVIVTTDGEIDDRCSMIRFLLYVNEWDVEGLIYSSSRFHWRGHNWAGEEWIDDQIDLYEDVVDRLQAHDPAYPDPDELRDCVAVGNVADVGVMDEETPGSDCIVEALLDDKPGPVYLQVWGGTNTVARALKTIEEEYPDRMAEVAETAIVYVILNQDRTLREYIQPHWPDLQVLNSFRQFAVFAYNWDELIPDPEVRAYLEDDWMREHVIDDHGPLCGAYPTADWDEGLFVSEGDTPAYFHQIPVGLAGLEHPNYGGWGGRFVREPGSKNVWIGAADDGDRYKPIWRWIPALQRDFAARADWCVTEPADANHPPSVVVNGEAGVGSVRRAVEPGAVVTLDGRESSDPDGDELAFEWWHYPEPSTGARELAPTIHRPHRAQTTVTVPEDDDREDHVILSVTDDGDPPLTRYRRVILETGK